MKNIIKQYALFLFFLLFPLFSLFAQTAAELDAMLETQTVTAAQAVRFVLGAAELLPPELSGAQAETAAYELALSNGWIQAAAGDAVTLRDTAFLVMKAFNLKGGLMYSLFTNPRYAYREMVYRGIIQGRADSAMKVSGQNMMHIIGRTLTFTGENEMVDLELFAGTR